MKRKIYEAIASHIDARINCNRVGNDEWFYRHGDMISTINDLLPSGSGFDSGSFVGLDDSTGESIVIRTSYHHMNGDGFYCCWSEHTLTVKASLIHGITVDIESDMSGVDIEGMCSPPDDAGEDWQPDDGDLSAELEWLEDSTQDYIVEVFSDVLSSGIEWDEKAERYKLSE